MSTPKYTFLLPAYKGRFLDEMLQSIQNQTYTNFKVIICDDCSPEDLKTICEPYLQDPRFEYRRNEINIGGTNLVEHWNMLVEMCTTEYLIMASDDDVYNMRFLEEVDKLYTKYPSVSLVRSRCERIGENKELLAKENPYDEYQNHLEFILGIYSNRHIRCMANYVFKTSTLKKMGKFVNFPKAWYSDVATAIQISQDGVANTLSPLFSFRMSNSQISYDHQEKTIIKDKLNATIRYGEWLDTKVLRNLSDRSTYEKNIIKAVSQHHASEMLTQIQLLGSSFSPIEYFQFLMRLKKLNLNARKYQYYLSICLYFKTILTCHRR